MLGWFSFLTSVVVGAFLLISPANAQAPATIGRPTPPPCTNPNALGVSRVVEIDTTGGPGFGLEHFKQLDFLRDHEVVLTFDDGPWPTTPPVLKALADQCVRATFFPIGKHATYYPEILRQVAAAGHTVGSHTWTHSDLLALTKKSQQEARDEIEKGLSAVHWALQGTPHAPFFRFPSLRHPPEMVTYLGRRNIAIFSTDIQLLDFKMQKPEEVTSSVMSKLATQGKGIIMMHDFQQATSMAIPALLTQLKAGGYKVVHIVAKANATTLPEYDELLSKEVPGGISQTVSSRPPSSAIQTVTSASQAPLISTKPPQTGVSPVQGPLLSPPLTAPVEKRVALVIGNRDYKSSVGALVNPLNDIRIVGSALKSVGFDLLAPIQNATRNEMLSAIYGFASALKAAGPDAVGFLYYSGHGLASAGENYLVPIDVTEPSTQQLSIQGVKQSEVLEILRREAPNAAHYLVLDACRNNLQGARGGKGFTPVGQQSGVLVAFSTEPGKTASDTGFGSGPYAGALAAELVKPGQIDLVMFHNVRVNVIAKTSGDQVPWTEDGIQRPQRPIFARTASESR